MVVIPGSGNNAVDELNASQIIDFLEISPQAEFKESLEVPSIMPKTTYTHSTILQNYNRKETAENEIEG